MNKRGLIESYKDPVERYGGTFINFEMMLADNRDNPSKMGELLDCLPSVYDYFMSLETYVDEERSTKKEELDVILSEIREFTVVILIAENKLPPSRPPTGESIKARINVWFNKYLYCDVNSIDLRGIYHDSLMWVDEDSTKDFYVKKMLQLLTDYRRVNRNYKELLKYYNILHARTTALKMRKDTIIESVRLLKGAINQGLTFGGDISGRKDNIEKGVNLNLDK